MFLTYEAPFATSPSRHAAAAVPPADLAAAYARRFAAAPEWLDALPAGQRRALLQRALRYGVPLTPADDPGLHFA